MDFTSDPGSDDTYGNGDRMELTVTFSEDVVVTGCPQAELYMDFRAQRFATFESSSGPNVVFAYTVQSSDSASDGIAVQRNGVSLNVGTIQDSAGNDANLSSRFYFPAGPPWYEYHNVDGSEDGEDPVGGL